MFFSRKPFQDLTATPFTITDYCHNNKYITTLKTGLISLLQPPQQGGYLLNRVQHVCIIVTRQNLLFKAIF